MIEDIAIRKRIKDLVYEYCVKNKYNTQFMKKISFRQLGKVDNRKLIEFYAVVISKGIEPDGLCNDMDTIPYVLFYVYEDGTIEECPDLKMFI